MTELRVKNEYFDVKQTLECGQVFRYVKTEKGYTVYSKSYKCELENQGDEVVLFSDNIDYFTDYFDLNTDYAKIVNDLSKFPELEKAVRYGKGIRILRQDFYETAISFIISANNNIKRIQGIIEKICKAVGDDMGDYFAFPTAEQLKKLSVDDYRKMGLGYRAPYLEKTSQIIGKDYLRLKNLPSPLLKKELCKYLGIGPKVADCIALFGLRKTDSYPVDTWIFKANKSEELDTPKKVCEYYQNRYGEKAGFAQQYIFYYARENKT